MWNTLQTNEVFIKCKRLFSQGSEIPTDEEASLLFIISSFCQVIFHRTQPSVKDEEFKEVKLRQVWCVPYFIICIERMFFDSIVKRSLEFGAIFGSPVYCSGLNNTELGNSLFRLREKVKILKLSKGYNIYQLDFKKFDSTVDVLFYDLFFDSISELICLSDEDRLLFNLLRQYNKSSTFTYKGLPFNKQRGISSGSFLTNYFGSVVNLCLLICAKAITEVLTPELNQLYFSGAYDQFTFPELMLKYNIKIENFLNFNCEDDILVCGDDGLWISGLIQNNVLKHICKSLGMTVLFSEPYGFDCDSIYFLGRYWDKLNRPYQPKMWYCSHMLFCSKIYDFEFEGWDDSMHFAVDRVLSIAYPYVNGLTMIEELFFSEGCSGWKELRMALDDPDYKFRIVKEWEGRDDDGRFFTAKVSDARLNWLS